MMGLSGYDTRSLGARLRCLRLAAAFSERQAIIEAEESAAFTFRAASAVHPALPVSPAPSSAAAVSQSALPYTGAAPLSPAQQSTLAEEEWAMQKPAAAGGGGGRRGSSSPASPGLSAGLASGLGGGAAAPSAGVAPRSAELKKVRLAAGSQAAVVKLASYGAGPVRAASLMNYQSDKGELSLEREDGSLVTGKEAVANLAAHWSEETAREPSNDVLRLDMAFDGKVSEDEARAAREVVVSAGSINSPQLLELSGIGQPDRLRELGIEVRHALPGVGENLRDHYAPRTRWAIGAKGITFNDRARGSGLVGQALRYAFLNQGMLGMVAAPIRAFVRSREGLEAPDVLLGWVPMLTEPGPKGPKLSLQSGVTCYAHPMRPESKGHIHIVSADARRPPAINFNFLSSPVDAELTVRAVRIACSVMHAPAMAPMQVTEIAPGPERATDDAILQWVKQAAETTYHPVGTCKMGVDPLAVVDPQLRVHGIEGLRVADASIMPALTSGNTNAPSIMIGEKAADLVLKAAA